MGALILGLMGNRRWHLIGAMLAALLIAGGWSYWKWSRAEMAALRSQMARVAETARDLQAENAHIRSDLLAVKQAQDAANQALAQARQTGEQASRVIRQKDLKGAARAHPRDLEKQINADTANAFKGFEEQSRAP